MGTVGSVGGSVAGGVIGSLIAPGVGTMIGSTIGGAVGKGAGSLTGGIMDKDDVQAKKDPFAPTGYKKGGAIPEYNYLHGGNAGMAPYHNISPERYDKMMKMMSIMQMIQKR